MNRRKTKGDIQELQVNRIIILYYNSIEYYTIISIIHYNVINYSVILELSM